VKERNEWTLPFVTSFGSGHGKKFFLDGSEVSDTEWSDMSEISPLPSTPFYYEKEDGFKVFCSLNYNHSFRGGSSLEFYGTQSKLKQIEIFQFSSATIGNSECSLSIAFLPETESLSLALVLDLELSESKEKRRYFFVGKNERMEGENVIVCYKEDKYSNGWIQREFILKGLEGDEKITSIYVLPHLPDKKAELFQFHFLLGFLCVRNTEREKMVEKMRLCSLIFF